VLLVWAVLCDSFELRDDGKADIFGAGLDTFQVESLPAELDLRIVFHLLLYEDEDAELDLTLIGPTMSNVQPVTYRLAAQPGPLHRPGSAVSQTEGIEVPYEVRTEGPHSIELYAAPHGSDSAPQQSRNLFFQVVEGLPEGY
jgi:hypothetical protein